MQLRCNRYFIMLAYVFSSEAADARWSQQDAARIDRFERLGSEYYNDVLSYRIQDGWRQDFERTEVGYMASMGSLNQKDFYYEERIKLSTPGGEAWQLGFEQERDENPIRKEDSRDLWLAYQFDPRFRSGPMLEAETEKAFTDIGWLAELQTGDWSGRFKAWLIDPLFTHKKPSLADRRTGQPWVYQGHISYQGKPLQVSAYWREETRVSWFQSESERHYLFKRRQGGFRLARAGEKDEYALQLRRFQEYEAFLYRDQSEEGADHAAEEWEASYQREQYKFALWRHRDRTYFTGNDENFPVGFPGLHRQRRIEDALMASDSVPLRDSATHTQQRGLILNYVHLRDDSDRKRTEIKFLWTFDFRLNPKARLLLGTTWDLDLLEKEAELRVLKRFWGGGFGQVLMAF